MDEQEKEEVLYRLDERTKRVDEKFDKLERQVAKNEKQIRDNKETVEYHDTTLNHIKWVVGGIGSILVATISGIMSLVARAGGVL